MKNLVNGKIVSLDNIQDAEVKARISARMESAIFELSKGDSIHLPKDLSSAFVSEVKIDGENQYVVGYPCMHVRGTEKSVYFLSFAALTRRSRTAIQAADGSEYSKIAEHDSQGFYGVSANDLAKHLAGKVLTVKGTRTITVPDSFDKVTRKMSEKSKERQTPVFVISGESAMTSAEAKEVLGQK